MQVWNKSSHFNKNVAASNNITGTLTILHDPIATMGRVKQLGTERFYQEHNTPMVVRFEPTTFKLWSVFLHKLTTLPYIMSICNTNCIWNSFPVCMFKLICSIQISLKENHVQLQCCRVLAGKVLYPYLFHLILAHVCNICNLIKLLSGQLIWWSFSGIFQRNAA